MSANIPLKKRPFSAFSCSLSLTMALAAGSAGALPAPPEVRDRLNLRPDNALAEVTLDPSDPSKFLLYSNFYGDKSVSSHPCAPLRNYRRTMLDPRMQAGFEIGALMDAREALAVRLKGRVPSVLEGDPEQAARVYAGKMITATLRAAELCHGPS